MDQITELDLPLKSELLMELHNFLPNTPNTRWISYKLSPITISQFAFLETKVYRDWNSSMKFR